MNSALKLCSALAVSLVTSACGGGGSSNPEVALAKNVAGISGGPATSVFDSVTVTLGVSGMPSTLVGDGRPLVAADQGTSVSIRPGDDPQFAALAAALTDGLATSIVLSTTVPGGGTCCGSPSASLAPKLITSRRVATAISACTTCSIKMIEMPWARMLLTSSTS